MPDMTLRTPHQTDAELEAQVIDMDNFDVDEAMEQVMRKRFAMQPAAVAAFRQAAAIGVKRLLSLVADDAKFDKLSTSDKLKVLEMIFDRAYGKTETASMSDMTNYRTGQDSEKGNKERHSTQLSEIADRMKQNRRALPDQRQHEVFPELRQKRSAMHATRAGGNVVPYNRGGE